MNIEQQHETIKFGNVLSVNSDGSQLCAIRWSKLSKYEIVNWVLNRPYDINRLPQIIRDLETQDYIDGVIYLTCLGGRLICYDGIHRIEALKLIDTKIDHKIFIHYYPVYDEKLIKQKFESINKCLPVPEIYTDAHKELDIKKKIVDIVKHFTEKYSNMFKGTKRPNMPHENRDAFTDKMYELVKELDIQEFCTEKIINLVEQFNELMRSKKQFLKMTPKQIKKCDENECYIFSRRDWKRVMTVSYYNSHINMKRV